MTSMAPAPVATAATTAAAAPATTGATAADEAARRAKIKATSQAFEAQMVSFMLQPMFEGLANGGPFGGGEAEGAYKSFLLDAFGRQIAKAGGIGLAQPVMNEMLKLQGLQ